MYTGKYIHPFRDQAHLNNPYQRYGFLGRKLAHKSRAGGSVITGQTALGDRYMHFPPEITKPPKTLSFKRSCELCFHTAP